MTPFANIYAKLVAARAWQWVVHVCALASVVPLYAGRHLPMSDLPEHVATIATLRHYWDPAWRSQEYFSLASFWATQYWLYDAVGAVLALILGSAERGNLLLLTAGGLGYTYGLVALLSALKKDTRLAIFGSVLFWGQALTVGLINYVVSLPVALVGLALVIRQAQAPTLRRGLWIGLVGVINFYLHLSSLIVFAVTATLATWLLPDVPRRLSPELFRRLLALPKRMLWMLPAVLGVAAMLVAKVAAHHNPQHDDGGSTPAFLSRFALLRSLPGWCIDVWRDHVDDVLGVLLLVTALVMCWPRRRLTTANKADSAQLDSSAQASSRAGFERLTLLMFLTVCCIYIAMPSAVGKYMFLLDVRLAPFVALFAALALRPKAGKVTDIAFAAAAVFSLLLAAHGAQQVRAFNDEEIGKFDALLTRLPAGSRLMYLNFAPHSKFTHTDIFGYFGAYYRASYGGITSFSFTEVAHWPVRYRDAWKPPAPSMWTSPCVFRNERDGAFFEYVLTHGDRNPFDYAPKGPTWEIIGGSRAWTLYRKVPGVMSVGDGEVDEGPCVARKTAESAHHPKASQNAL